MVAFRCKHSFLSIFLSKPLSLLKFCLYLNRSAYSMLYTAHPMGLYVLCISWSPGGGGTFAQSRPAVRFVIKSSDSVPDLKRRSRIPAGWVAFRLLKSCVHRALWVYASSGLHALTSRDGHSHFFMLYIASRDFRLFVLRTAALLNELLLSGGGVCVLPAWHWLSFTKMADTIVTMYTVDCWDSMTFCSIVLSR